jgi:hypothetical protein
MANYTLTNTDDGSVLNLFDQSHVDAAVAAAVAAVPAGSADDTVTEVDVKEADGEVVTMEPVEANETTEDAAPAA